MPPSVRSPEEWAVQEILSAAEYLSGRFHEFLKPYGVSFTQYSALVILKGEPDGLPSSVVGERMATRDSDITRLVDRLAARGLVERKRDDKDRRVARIRLTAAGATLIEETDTAVLEFSARCFQNVKPKRIRRVIEVLNQLQDDRGY